MTAATISRAKVTARTAMTRTTEKQSCRRAPGSGRRPRARLGPHVDFPRQATPLTRELFVLSGTPMVRTLFCRSQIQTDYPGRALLLSKEYFVMLGTLVVRTLCRRAPGSDGRPRANRRLQIDLAGSTQPLTKESFVLSGKVVVRALFRRGRLRQLPPTRLSCLANRRCHKHGVEAIRDGAGRARFPLA